MPIPRYDDEAVDPQNVQPVDDKPRTSDSSTSTLHEHVEEPMQRTATRRSSVAALLRNPLTGMTEQEVLQDVDAFVEDKGLQEYRTSFRKGALIARVQHREDGFNYIDSLTNEDKDVLRHEKSHRWSQSFGLLFLVVLCAGSAVVQGMDQTAVNGAQVYYFDEFNITNEWQQGLLNGAPYLCSLLIGCWTNAPLNKYFGRRGTIFISCFISFASSFWMAAANTWWNLLIARFALGLAVGAKSSTTPVYAAESAPKTIRGALTMMWQMFTALGIALGFVASVAFSDLTWPGTPGPDGTAQYAPWRWMLGSTAIPPAFVSAMVYFCPESPRWYMEKGRFAEAFQSFCRLRKHPILAARDMYYSYKLLQVEAAQREGKNLFKEIFTVKRNRRAAQSAAMVMYMQQFCGVNVIAYYSTTIFEQAGWSRNNALLVSLGTGLVNFVFAIPAVYTIDTFGRRNLLLVGYPLMAICLFWTGFSFWIPDDAENRSARIGSIAAGIFTFMAAYSPTSGPVPFTYSAEAFPLYIRDVGMSLATAICWGFNFIISLTWPALVRAFTPQGAFAWYACWNIAATIYAYFLLPETKGLTLEELDTVFAVGNKDHATYYVEKLPYYGKRLLGKEKEAYPPLYQLEDEKERA